MADPGPGLHAGFDQWLTDGVGIFGRYGQSSTGPGSLVLGPVHRSYSAGTQFRFDANGQEASGFWLGFSQAFPIVVDAPLASERILEAYYRRQLSANLSSTPDFQLVFGAGGTAAETNGSSLVSPPPDGMLRPKLM